MFLCEIYLHVIMTNLCCRGYNFFFSFSDIHSMVRSTAACLQKFAADNSASPTTFPAVQSVSFAVCWSANPTSGWPLKTCWCTLGWPALTASAAAAAASGHHTLTQLIIVCRRLAAAWTVWRGWAAPQPLINTRRCSEVRLRWRQLRLSRPKRPLPFLTHHPVIRIITELPAALHNKTKSKPITFLF